MIETAVPTTDFFAERLDAMTGPLATVVDLGAHTGSLTLPALARGAAVVAVEPCLYHMMTLVTDAGKVGNGSLLPVVAAVWDTGGHLFPLYRRVADGKLADRGQLSLLPYLESQVIGWAATVTLEEVFRNIPVPEIDLLKMDMEGAEHRVLPATQSAVIRRARYIDLDDHDISNAGMFGQHGVHRFDLPALLRLVGFELRSSGLWERVN
jgi:FkbM family methyltransferase